MTDIQLQANAPIVPNQSLGGLKLRTSAVLIQDLIMQLKTTYLISKKRMFRLASPFEAMYEFEKEGIAVYVDVRNGKIHRLTALPGYKGVLFGKICVGMKIADAMMFESRLYYDEPNEVIYCRGCPGLAIDVPEADPFPEYVPQLQIHAISVYAEEAFTPAGNKGVW